MEYYTAMGMDTLQGYATIWINLINTPLSKRSHTLRIYIFNYSVYINLKNKTAVLEVQIVVLIIFFLDLGTSCMGVFSL